MGFEPTTPLWEPDLKSGAITIRPTYLLIILILYQYYINIYNINIISIILILYKEQTLKLNMTMPDDVLKDKHA